MKVIIIGGGWAGVSAGISAKKAGADVHIYEKTDLLLGLGNVGGIMRNNGRYTALEELKVLGGYEFVNVIDSCCRHKDIDFPGHKHASLYDVNKIEGVIRDYVKSLGINIHMESRVYDVNFDGHKIKGIYLSDETYVEGDVL